MSLPDFGADLKLARARSQLEGHCQRYLARRALPRAAVEIRRLPPDASERRRRLFVRERDELARLDHPVFLPVLATGEAGGAPYYLVPARDAPALDALFEHPDARDHWRCRWVRSLAAALAELHLIRVTMGPVHPALWAYDLRKDRVHVTHHRHSRPSPYPAEVTPRLPDDVRPGAVLTSRADLFHWGYAAHVLLTGSGPYPAGSGGPIPLLDRVPWLAPEVGEAVDHCLQADPKARMASAAELHALLQDTPEDRRRNDRVGPRSSLAESIEVLRVAGKIPEPEGGDEPADRDEPGDAGGGDPGLGTAAAGGARPDGAPPATGEPPPADAPADPRTKDPTPPAAPGDRDAPPPTGRVLAAGLGVAALAGLALVTSGPAPPPESPAPRAAPALPRPRAAPADPLGDPYLRLLLKADPVTPRHLPRLYKIFVSVYGKGLIPAHLRDEDRVRAIGTRAETDAPGAAKDLEYFLADLREHYATGGGGERPSPGAGGP